LLQAVGEASHDGCLVLTRREAPSGLVRLTSERALAPHGLGPAEAQVLLADWRLNADAQAWLQLVQRDDRNGLVVRPPMPTNPAWYIVRCHACFCAS
jgi:hypothetical protein